MVGDDESYDYSLVDDDGEFDEKLGHITQPPIAGNEPQIQAIEQPTPKADPPMELKTVRKAMRDDIDYKDAMKRMKIMPTLRINYPTLKVLGIAKDVFWYLDALKLRAFIEFEHPSYSFLTREFLSTVTLAYPRCKRPLANNGVLYFRILDEEYSLTIAQMGASRGLEYHDAIEFNEDSKALEVRRRFSNEDFEPGRSKSAYITNPAIHYAHRLWANTMFARTSQRNVLRDEFIILHAPFVVEPRRLTWLLF